MIRGIKMMKIKSLKVMVLIMAASMFIVPVFAGPGNGPKYDKFVASLELGQIRYGQIIYNSNPEDDGFYELEVEVEECMDLASTTVDIKIDAVIIGTIDVDEFGNGKATFYVEDPSLGVTVDGLVDLVSGEWRDWVKQSGKK
jgi:hypothetical protein